MDATRHENQFSMLHIIRDLSILGSGFFGIQGDDLLLHFVQFLIQLAQRGHPTNYNSFRQVALEILKNIVYELLYDEALNAARNFKANTTYPNFDASYEAEKMAVIERLNAYLPP
jgi:hypothetical protein